jgi:hypothetical protein
MGVEENGPRGDGVWRLLQEEVNRREQQKRPNAEKHGVFSADRTIPGEDPREFEELHSALIDEWKPAGPTEEDAVFSLADLMWRKRRAQYFLQSKLTAITRNPEHHAFDEEAGLRLFIELMRGDPEAAFEEEDPWFLRRGTINHLKQRYPRSNYETTSQWAEAVIREIECLLLTSAMYDSPSEDDSHVMAATIVCRKERKFLISVTDSSEWFEEELKVRERLDANISRVVKFLIQDYETSASPNRRIRATRRTTEKNFGEERF